MVDEKEQLQILKELKEAIAESIRQEQRPSELARFYVLLSEVRERIGELAA